MHLGIFSSHTSAVVFHIHALLSSEVDVYETQVDKMLARQYHLGFVASLAITLVLHSYNYGKFEIGHP